MQDLRLASSPRGHAGVTAVAIMSLALGIGATPRSSALAAMVSSCAHCRSPNRNGW